MRLMRFLEGYRAAALIAFNTVLLFVLLNCLLLVAIIVRDAGRNRIQDRYPYVAWEQIYPGLSTTEIELLLTESSTIPMLYEPYTQYREARFEGTFFNVVQAGYRRSVGGGSWPPDPGKFNVFLFGGSTTFGYGVADDETIASHMYRQLANGATTEINVYNFGRAGYRSSQERILFQELLMSGHIPDLAIFIDGLNDFAHYEPLFTPELTRLFDRQNLSTGGATWAGVRENVAKLPIVRLAEYLSGTSLTDSSGIRNVGLSGHEYVRAVVDRYIESVGQTEAVAQKYGVHPVFVWQPVPMYDYDVRYHPFAEGGFMAINRYAKDGYIYMESVRHSANVGPNFLWLADIQQDLRRPLYVDKVHYSDEMNGIVAANILEQLRNRALLP